MASVLENEEQLKEVFKTALIEVLQERKELVRELLEEIFEDIAFSKAIAEGEESPQVSRKEIFELLEKAS